MKYSVSLSADKQTSSTLERADFGRVYESVEAFDQSMAGQDEARKWVCHELRIRPL
jgi:hypothetical protein